MSSNNELLLIKTKKSKRCPFEVHENPNVGNTFYVSERTLLRRFPTLVDAIKFANKYCEDEIVEYGYRIHWSCLGEKR